MKEKTDFILEVFKDRRTVFTFNELGLLLGETDSNRLKQKVNYFVRRQRLLNIRKGIYAKKDYNPEELACKINTPSYLSLEYVLRKAGAIFQYSASFTVVSYLSRTLEVDGQGIQYRRIKESILVDTTGIERLPEGINIAEPERAFLDLLYLDQEFHLDHPHVLKRKRILEILPIYGSNALNEKVHTLLSEFK
ncbi:MAG: hypothetical protein V2I46_06380 [Bacteroides sp.]|jgi:hypothetical protein|nr:hypothetical protein [Bacteroides sp.]